MDKNWYRETLVALKLRKPRNMVHNMLTEVAIRTDDEKLRIMVNQVITELTEAGSNTETNPLVDTYRVDTKSLQYYCEKNGYPQQVEM